MSHLMTRMTIMCRDPNNDKEKVHIELKSYAIGSNV